MSQRMQLYLVLGCGVLGAFTGVPDVWTVVAVATLLIYAEQCERQSL
jgi:hypothetical protein